MDLQVNEKQIQPINWGLPGDQKVLQIIRFDNLHNYGLDGGAAQAHYVLFTAQVIPAIEAVAEIPATETTPAVPAVEAQPEQTIKTPIVAGNIDVPATVIAEWTNDDSVIYNYVLQLLNLQEIQ